jgi:hypothetical protein
LPLRTALVLTAVLALAACRRSTGPDANYEKASQMYQQLYATELDDAYGDPKMDEVVGLLKRVDPRSSDAESATSLLGTIQRGRTELAKQRAERERMGAAAAASAASAITNLDPEKILAAGAADAGQRPPQDPYGAGAAVAEINAQTGGCLTEHEPFNEQGTKVDGAVYRLARGPGCADKLPGFVGQAVLVVNGKIYRRIPDPSPPPAAPAAPPQPAARPGGGATAQAPAAAVPQPAAQQGDGGEPTYQMVLPGQPQPGAPPPADRQQ